MHLTQCCRRAIGVQHPPLLNPWLQQAHVSCARTHAHALVGPHGFQQRHTAAEVVVIVLKRLLHTLPHSLEASKVDDRVKLLLAEELV